MFLTIVFLILVIGAVNAADYANFTLNYPPNESTNISKNPTLNVTVVDLEDGSLNVTFLKQNADFPTEHQVSSDPYDLWNGAKDVFAADIDNDGDIDVLTTEYNYQVWPYYFDRIVWFENDGSESFTYHIIIETESDGFSSVYASDIDSDGDMDILGINDDFGVPGYSGEVYWFENVNGDGSNWTTHYIAKDSINRGHQVIGIDMDEDGDVDVLHVAYSDEDIVWWENNGSESFTKHVIHGSSYSFSSIYVEDIDHDGDFDLLAGDIQFGRFGWFENNGSESFTWNLVDDEISPYEYYMVSAIDLDGMQMLIF